MIAALAAALLIWRAELLAPGIPLFGNMVLYVHPLYEQATRQLQAGSLPLWNPLQSMGVPLLANPQAGVLAPAHVLFRLLPFETALRLNLAVDVLLLASGSFLLARVLGVRRGAAVLAAVVACGNGFAFYHSGLTPQFDSLALAPYVLLFWVSGRGALAGLALALQAAGGHPFFVYMTLAACALMTPLRPWSALWRAAASAAGAGALVWLGAAALFSASARGLALDRRAVFAYSLEPDALWRMLTTPWWNRSAEAFLGDATITSFYLGLPALALAARGAWLGRLPRVAALAALSLALAMGPALPLYPALLGRLPGLSLFRYPAQWAGLAALAAALLAAEGLRGLGPRARAAFLLAVALDLAAFCAAPALPRAPMSLLAARPAAASRPELAGGLRLAHAPSFFQAQPEAASLSRWPDLLKRDLAPSHASVFGLPELTSYNVGAAAAARAATERAFARRDGSALSRLGAGLVVETGPDGRTFMWPVKGAWRAAMAPSGSARLVEEAGARAVLSVEAPAPARLSFSAAPAPGWRAYVDGVPAALSFEGASLAFDVPAGARQAVLLYRPAYAAAGSALAVLSLLAFLAAGLRAWARCVMLSRDA